MCCVTVDDSPSYSAATLFDTGAHTSFVNREVAAWIVQQSKTVSLAGPALSSAILGSVFFDLSTTFTHKSSSVNP
jgi:hypothetical protein